MQRGLHRYGQVAVSHYLTPWFGTEVIHTVLLLLLFPDIGSRARSSSVHGMDGPGGKRLVTHCVIDMKKWFSEEKTTKMVVRWEATNAWHGKVPGGSKGERHYCTYILSVGLPSPRLY